jgi:putative peptidoglycan lipid II flippase
MKGIAHSTGVLAASTGLSRVLGFVRDLFLAHLFGTGVQSEAFVVAFRLPNLMRDLVAEGAVTSAFVPVLSWYRAKGQSEQFWGLSHTLLARLSVLLCGLGLAGSLAAPAIVWLIAPGFAAQPELFDLTVRLTRILFPFVTLVGLWAYFMGLLNSLRHFAVPALGPAILNLCMIAACLWFVPRAEPGVLALTISVVIGGVIQLLVQLPVAMRLGFRFRWRWRHPGSREVLGLLGPRILGAAVYQASVLIHTALASLSAVVGTGAVAALYFANRLVQLPLALFGMASAQASLPALSEQAARGEWERFRSTLISVIRMVGFVILPASAGLMVLAFPIIGGLFERGAFDHRSTVMTAQALICYSLGLMAYSIAKVLTGAFYAVKDTWTPVRLAAEAVTVNILLSVALMWPLQVSGLALGAAGANTLNAYRLIRRMEGRLSAPLLAPLLAPLGRIALASILMGAFCWELWRSGLAGQPAWLALPLVVTAGMVVYLGACALLRVPELSTVIRWLNSLPLLQLFAGR